MSARRSHIRSLQVVDRSRLTNVGAPQLDLKINAKASDEVVESQQVRHMDRVFILALFAMLVVSLVIIFALGTNVYRSLAQSRTESEQVRVQTSLLTTSVRTNDEYDFAKKTKGPEGPALVLRERTDDGTYETRLYLYKGNLMQEYAVAESKIDPKRATALCPVKRFSFRIKNGLVSILTDVGQTNVALRSEGGGR